MEYSVRIEQWKIADVMNETTVQSPQTLFNVVRDKFNPIQEEMYVLAVNSQNQMLDCFLISKGGYNALYCVPRDIFFPLIQSGAVKFFLAHNHPSGNVTPSEEDLTFTKKVSKGAETLGLNLLDHLVFSANEHFSFRSNGLIK